MPHTRLTSSALCTAWALVIGTPFDGPVVPEV